MAKATSNAIGKAVATGFVAAAVILAAVVLRRLDQRPRTTDAIVTANTIQVAPEITGRIDALNVKDDAVVKKGDVLFTIEAEQYQLALARARAQARMLEAQINLGDRNVSAQVTAISVADARVESARARLKDATDTLERMEPLLVDRYVTPHQIDQARTAKATAESDVRGALSSREQSRWQVGDTRPLAAQLDAARAQVGLAERDLRNTVIRAPFDGRVVGVTTSVGQLVSPGHALFTLIDTSQWFVLADFRETELGRMRPGEKVTAYVMSAPSQHLGGIVKSVGSAVADADGPIVAGVPSVQRDLNWVRIAQRFRVRIALQDPPEELMRIGASAVVVVQHDG